MNLKKPKIA